MYKSKDALAEAKRKIAKGLPNYSFSWKFRQFAEKVIEDQLHGSIKSESLRKKVAAQFIATELQEEMKSFAYLEK